MADESTEIEAVEDGPPTGPAPRMHFPGLRHYIIHIAAHALRQDRTALTDQLKLRVQSIAERAEPVRRIVDIITNAVRSDDKKNVAETLENARLQLEGLMVGLMACVSALTDVCDGKEIDLPEWLDVADEFYVNCDVIKAPEPVVVKAKEASKPKSPAAEPPKPDEPPTPPVEPPVDPPATGEAPPVEPPKEPTPPPARPGPGKKDK